MASGVDEKPKIRLALVHASMQNRGSNFLLEPATRPQYQPLRKKSYFEIQIHMKQKFPFVIGVGLGDTPRDSYLPGQIKGSIGYNSNGRLFCEGIERNYGETFTDKNVVGCGLDHENNLFFTVNGRYQGIVQKIPEGQGWYGMVGCQSPEFASNNESLRLLLNMGGKPFKFELFNLFPVQYSGLPLLDFPDIILENIVSKLIPQNTAALLAVNNKLQSMIKNHRMWKKIVEVKWPTVKRAAITIRNYYRFYARRTKALSRVTNRFRHNPDSFIDNCDQWEFLCPIKANMLQLTANPEVFFCKDCQKEVHLVHNYEQLDQKAEQRLCVLIDFKNRGRLLLDMFKPARGGVRAPKRTPQGELE